VKPIRMVSLCLALTAAGAIFLPLAGAPQATASTASEPDWAALLGPFPAAGSREAERDLAIMLWLQKTRTTAEVARANAEIALGVGWFQDVLGKDFDPATHPRTLTLLNQAAHDCEQVISPLKNRFRRPRPYLTTPELTPAIHRETSFSYPSGHSTLAILSSLLLAELDPRHRDAILERGRLIGNDRSLGGVHWPSDVEAGQKLGTAFAGFWLAMPKHRQLVTDIRAAEWH
jgi:acid phosphatase (class A)